MPVLSPPEALSYGAALHRAGRLEEAEGVYRQLLEILPDEPDALHLLGVVRRRQHRLEEGVALIRRSLAVRPGFAVAWSNLGHLLSDLGHDDQAIHAYQTSLSLAPDEASNWSYLGTRLWMLRRYREAVAAYDNALALDPDLAEARFNLGVSYQKMNRLEEARHTFAALVQRHPDHAVGINSLGNVIRDLGQPQEALRFHRHALALEPDFLEARKCLALTHLVCGDYAEGFLHYESRRQLPDGRTLTVQRPEWTGEQPLAGRTLLLYAEQGQGDTLHFIRYARVARQQGARVLFGAPDPLVRLMRLAPDIDAVIPHQVPVPAFDYHLPLLSAGRAFRTTRATLPHAVPYLFADPALVKQWGAYLGARQNRLRVGLTWAGNAQYGADHHRTLRLDHFRPLFQLPDVEFVALQLGDGRQDLETWDFPGGLRDPGPEITDFADTAALMMHLDVIISVDTSVAHLAGALGRPLWLLLPTNNDWRWLKGISHSPWYPTARLFRQQIRGDWSHPLQAVMLALMALSFT